MTTTPRGICQCGCGGSPRNATSRYIKGHAAKALHAGRHATPGPGNGDGLCACGCGGATLLALRDHPAQGIVRGFPRKWLRGHKTQYQKRKPGDRKLCDDGYIRVYRPDHPRAANGWVLEHRLIMEERLGRYLLHSEEVHHDNRCRSDNRLYNLILCVSKGEHRSLHAGERWARHYDACVVCGRTDRLHAAHGLCTTCYAQRDRETK